MENGKKDHQRFYPARLDPNNPQKITLIPISEDDYHTLMLPIWKHQHKMKALGKCRCTKESMWICDADCELCELKMAGNIVSMDEKIETTLEKLHPGNSDPVLKQVISQQILSRLNDLFPEAIKVGKLIQSGMSQREAVNHLGIKRSTFQSRLKKVSQILSAEFGVDDIKNFF